MRWVVVELLLGDRIGKGWVDIVAYMLEADSLDTEGMNIEVCYRMVLAIVVYKKMAESMASGEVDNMVSVDRRVKAKEIAEQD